MLSIGKLGHGQADYYLDSVAQGGEDYYTGAGEAPGQWAGGGCEDLGLTGRVDAQALRRVLSAQDPRSGKTLPRPAGSRGARAPGYDFTFSAPKSVSLLFALGDERVSDVVRDAHEAAVGSAVAHLEQRVAVARRGHNGVDRRETSGLVAARFRHRTSRAGDPQLHTHVLVANLVKAKDDLWSAPDVLTGYRQARTAGFLYQAELRARLTQELGLRWRAVHNGTAEIVGVPQRVLRAFSRRRAEIVAHLEAIDGEGKQAGQIAALATRKAKDYSVAPESLADGWLQRAIRLGFGPRQLEAVLERCRGRSASAAELRAAMMKMAGPEGLTHRASSFDRSDVLRAWCEQLPQGAEVHEVEDLAEGFLASDCSVALIDPRLAEHATEEGSQSVRYCTPELLATEQRSIEGALSRRHGDVGRLDAQLVERVLGGRARQLSEEQEVMVRALCSSGDGVQVVVGVAGAGKTFALDAAREGWEVGGHRVIGCAVAASAAKELQDGTGIPSFTLAGLLCDLREGEAAALGPRTVVVVDEAGMAGTRDLAELLGYAEDAGWKVVLCGDDRQLPEIDAGGLFRALRRRAPAIELTENHRQQQGWERDALRRLRDGDVSDALEMYDAHDELRTAPTAALVRDALVAAWWADRDPAREPASGRESVMIAYRRADVADLNARARALMLANGALGHEQLTANGRLFAVGDRVVAHKNARHLRLMNRDSGVVTSIDLTRRELTFRHDQDGRERNVPATYLDHHLDHGYAITGHKVQGQTVERAHVLGTPEIYREWGYVALSRGQHRNTFYLCAPTRDLAGEQPHGPPEISRDASQRVARALGRSRAQTAASDLVEDANLKAAPTPALAAEQRQLKRTLDPHPARQARQLERLAAERAEAEREAAQAATQRLAAERQLADRGRLRRGRAKDLRQAMERADTSQALARERAARRAAEQRELEAQTPSRDQWDARNAQTTERHAAVTAELERREHAAARRAELVQPEYLTHEIGTPPQRPSQRREWRDAARAIEGYRQRHGITDPQRALGPRPRELEQRRDHLQTQRAIEHAQHTLQRTAEHVAELEL